MKYFCYSFGLIVLVLAIIFLLLAIFSYNSKNKSKNDLLGSIIKCVVPLLGLIFIFTCFTKLFDYKYLLSGLIVFIIYVILVFLIKILILTSISRYSFIKLIERIGSDIKDSFKEKTNVFSKIGDVLLFLISPDFVITRLSEDAHIINYSDEYNNKYIRVSLKKSYSLLNLVISIILCIICYFTFYFNKSSAIYLGLKALIIYHIISRSVEELSNLFNDLINKDVEYRLSFKEKIIINSIKIIEFAILMVGAYLSYKYIAKDALAGGMSTLLGNLENKHNYYGLTALSTMSFTSCIAILINLFISNFKNNECYVDKNSPKLMVINKDNDRIEDMFSLMDHHDGIASIVLNPSRDQSYVIYYDNKYYGYRNVISKNLVNNESCVNDNFSINESIELTISFNKENKEITIK